MYAKSDGNGGVLISNTLIALITMIILVLGTCASVVAYSVGVSETASHALQVATKCTEDQVVAGGQITKNKENIAVITSQYDDIIRRLESIENKLDQK